MSNGASIRHAVILAAGRGMRMGEATHDIPKPMLSIHGRPMLEHIFERLASAGVEKFFVVVGYRHDAIERHFLNSRLNLEFRVQVPVNGTGSAALLAREFAMDQSFLLTYGDILCDPSEYVRCASELEQNSQTSAVIAVKDVDDPWQGAAVYEQQRRVRMIIEKPPKGTSTTRWNSAGFYAFRPTVFEYLRRVKPSSRNEYELTSALEMMLEDGLTLRISAIRHAWLDVGRPEDLRTANLLS